MLDGPEVLSNESEVDLIATPADNSALPGNGVVGTLLNAPDSFRAQVAADGVAPEKIPAESNKRSAARYPDKCHLFNTRND